MPPRDTQAKPEWPEPRHRCLKTRMPYLAGAGEAADARGGGKAGGSPPNSMQWELLYPG